jgi:hypothetical protein
MDSPESSMRCAWCTMRSSIASALCEYSHNTSAILDRIFHHSVIVKIKGPSYRKHQGERLQKEYAEKKTGDAETG